MAIPNPEGGTRPPNLDELIKILRAAKHIKLEHSFENDSITISFKVTKADAVEENLHLYTTGSQFTSALLQELERLAYFEQVTEKYSDPDVKGTMPADMIAFLDNEIRHCHSGNLEDTMRRRMCETLKKKMEELSAWRGFVDRERMDKAREYARRNKEERDRAEKEQAKKQSQFNDEIRKMREEMLRRQEEVRRKQEEEKREQAKQKGQAGPEDNPYTGPYNYEEVWKQYKRYSESGPFGRGFGGFGGFDDYSREQQQRRRQQESGNGSRRSADVRKRWYEILGVLPGADKATIKAAWRKLAKEFHPDRNKAPDAAARMAEINAAKDEGLSR